MKNNKTSQNSAPISNCAYPPGHYYSPVPSIAELKQNENKIFKPAPRSIPGINLNIENQLKLLEVFSSFYKELPFSPRKQSAFRYYYDNPYYSYGDAISLYCMLRHLNPNNIIEVGSGFSSAVTLDTREQFLNNKTECTFIEPYPERLLSLLKPEEDKIVKIISSKLQDLPNTEIFDELGENDILFIDSTHVSRTGNDVNKLYLEIIPKLKSGTYIHIHDIFYPFEYPKEWVFEGRAWNELYLLAAFLQFNSQFEIVFFNHMLATLEPGKLYSTMPLYKNNPGGSIWLRRL